MVLVGHSMGGLLARLQTLESGNEFWETVANQPFQYVRAPDDARRELASAFFFLPNPAIHRVITVGTPYRGSEFSNSTTRWLSSKFIKLPELFLDSRLQLRKDNPNLFKKPSLIDVDTSIDSLAPDSPFLPVMLAAGRPQWVRHHTIIGVVPEKGFLHRVVGDSDGVVSVESARLETADSELVVSSDHTTIHSHPLAVLEVHRILLAHLAEVDRGRPPTWPQAPMTVAAPANHSTPLRPTAAQPPGTPDSVGGKVWSGGAAPVSAPESDARNVWSAYSGSSGTADPAETPSAWPNLNAADAVPAAR
jgi:hypothetical protein